MGGFGFTEQQEMFRREVRNFVQKELLPGAKERAGVAGIPRDIVRKVAGMGLIGLRVPEKYGGQPADWVTVGIAIEELARGDFFTSCLPTQGIFSSYLFEKNEAICEEWLPAIVKGERTVCLALTESEVGSDAANIKTRAVRDGDVYVLSGEKLSISFGPWADAAILFAKTDPKAGFRGISAFLVPTNSPGVTRSTMPMMGWRPVGQAIITLDNVRVPRGRLLGEEGKGFAAVMTQFDFTRPVLALQALALAQLSLEDAISYAQQRQAFGQPLAKYEGVSFKIAEDLTLVEAARLLCYRALWLREQGLPHSKESAMCKWLGPKVAVRAIHDSLLTHGHVGYSEEYPLQQRLKDAIGFEIADGTAEIMKLIVVREALGKEFAK
ncbi:MAG: acyl-CoA dehydrogenase family protein [Chloroflexi bacterium]|nr:acyl-CoA dehydrogenase family protein [Chloroflexota bacterium]